MGTTAPTGFIGFITTYGSIIGFFVQLAFYVVLAGAVLWAAIVFNRLVKFLTAGSTAVGSADKGVSVEEFVD